MRNISGATTMTLTTANGVPSIHHHLSTVSPETNNLKMNPIFIYILDIVKQGAMGALLRAVSYPPVLPLMHPALRGLCKPSLVGLTAGSCAMMQTNCLFVFTRLHLN